MGGPDRVVEWRNAGVARVPGLGQLAFVIPEVAALLLGAEFAVDTADELTPADDLPDETLDALERGITNALADCVHDLPGRQKPEVQARAQDAVEHGIRARREGILVRAEVIEARGGEVREPGPRLLARRRPAEFG